MPLLDRHQVDYRLLCQSFRWNIPDSFNIGTAVCDRQADGSGRVALYLENGKGEKSQYSFDVLKSLSNRFANVLREMGVRDGDRVAVILPQRVETVIAHIAIYKLGAIAVPLSVLFGSDAVKFRLDDSGTGTVITDRSHRDMVEDVAAEQPLPPAIIDVDNAGKNGFWSLINKAAEQFRPVNTRADDPAIIIYTSGTTGPPKGALIAHRCLLGNLTGFEASHNFFPQPNDLFWTPADWAWTGGLIDALLPSLYYGVPVLGFDGGKFDPELVCDLLARYQVRNGFIPPTALKMLRQLGDLRSHYRLNFRSVMSAGEALGAELFEWGKHALGLEINEMWAQSEFNYIAGNCSCLMPVRPGSLGKGYPGHRVQPVDPDGNPLPVGETGELAARRDDPVFFLGYWNNPEATEAKFRGDWWGTGDVGYRDEEGYLWFVGRDDDVISSAGYRIGPGEIEDCLLKHKAVANAAAVGSPDELRGEIVKAFIVLNPGFRADEDLKKSIQDSVRKLLAAYEYPRVVEFVEALPMTTTGKVRRIELRQRERQEKI